MDVEHAVRSSNSSRQNLISIYVIILHAGPSEIPCGSFVYLEDYPFDTIDIVSPGWPSGYENDEYCYWIVTASTSYYGVKAEAIEWEARRNPSQISLNHQSIIIHSLCS